MSEFLEETYFYEKSKAFICAFFKKATSLHSPNFNISTIKNFIRGEKKSPYNPFFNLYFGISIIDYFSLILYEI